MGWQLSPLTATNPLIVKSLPFIVSVTLPLVGHSLVVVAVLLGQPVTEEITGAVGYEKVSVPVATVTLSIRISKRKLVPAPMKRA